MSFWHLFNSTKVWVEVGTNNDNSDSVYYFAASPMPDILWGAMGAALTALGSGALSDALSIDARLYGRKRWIFVSDDVLKFEATVALLTAFRTNSDCHGSTNAIGSTS